MLNLLPAAGGSVCDRRRRCRRSSRQADLGTARSPICRRARNCTGRSRSSGWSGSAACRISRPISRIGMRRIRPQSRRAMAARPAVDPAARSDRDRAFRRRARARHAGPCAGHARRPRSIVDEPLASLDPGHQIEVMALLAGRARVRVRWCVVVLHDLAAARALLRRPGGRPRRPDRGRRRAPPRC